VNFYSKSGNFPYPAMCKVCGQFSMPILVDAS
jgi:hypothetical protein